MKRYNITIKFKNGDKLDANVMARNQADAVNRLKKSEQFIENYSHRHKSCHTSLSSLMGDSPPASDASSDAISARRSVKDFY